MQTLIDVPLTELATTLGYQEKKTQDLQETLQRFLDRKEEERQSKELLQLYLKAVNQETQREEGSSQNAQQGTTVINCITVIKVKPMSYACYLNVFYILPTTNPNKAILNKNTLSAKIFCNY